MGKRIAGILDGGSGKSSGHGDPYYRNDITYATPIEWIVEDIEEGEAPWETVFVPTANS